VRIGFEATSAIGTNLTGIGHYIQSIVPAIERELSAGEKLMLFYKASRLKKYKDWWRPKGLDSKAYYKSYWPVVKNVDLLHGLDGMVPNWRNAAKVVTIHDLAAIKLNNDEISSQTFRTRKLKNYLKTIAYADAIITDSEATKQDVVSILGVPADRVFVVHLGIDKKYKPQDRDRIDALKTRYDLNNAYLLFMGAISSRKNTERLVEAYAKSSAKESVDLVLAGGMGYQHEKTIEAIKKNGLHGKVKVMGYLPEKDIPVLYSGALGFVFPTLYEGFGLPILEAMACGTPVLTGNTGSAPEVSGGHAVLVDPYEVEDISKGIDQLLDRPVQMNLMLDHAARFTWQHCAVKTIQVYKKLIG